MIEQPHSSSFPAATETATNGETALAPDGGATPRRDIAAWLSVETVRIQEEERRKLSLELHDDIAQILGNLVLMMGTCLSVAPAEAVQLRRYLVSARDTAREGFRRVQRFSLELRPPMLDDLGLAPTIAWYAERMGKDTGLSLAVSIPEGLPPLSGEQETALFRIVQEALNNISKHAHARQASVSLEQLPLGLRLSIVDDGVGFDAQILEQKLADGTHLGLAGMRYRTELLRGTFELTSSTWGTRIIVEIPLP